MLMCASDSGSSSSEQSEGPGSEDSNLETESEQKSEQSFSNDDACDFFDDLDGQVNANNDGWNSDDCDTSGTDSGSDSPEISEDGHLEEEFPLFFGIVKWPVVNGVPQPFSEAGDSGSLVIFRDGNITVPLGIHVARTTSYPKYGSVCSVFIAVDGWFRYAASQRRKLKFYSR
jgi:hypothetical protein